MKMLFEARSTNGRSGVQVVGTEDVEYGGCGRTFAVPGALKALGKTAGMSCFEHVTADPGHFVVVGGDLRVVEGAGATEVNHQDLQSGQEVTILHARVGACWKWAGYKGRSSGYSILREGGVIEDAPAALLLAAGLVEPREAPAPAPPAPTFNGAFAAALKKAGL